MKNFTYQKTSNESHYKWQQNLVLLINDGKTTGLQIAKYSTHGNSVKKSKATGSS